MPHRAKAAGAGHRWLIPTRHFQIRDTTGHSRITVDPVLSFRRQDPSN